MKRFSFLINNRIFGGILKNPHFYICLAIIALLGCVYHHWPWADWRNASGLGYFRYFFSKLAVIEFNYRIVGSFFLIPAFYAILVFKWRGVVLAWLVVLGWVIIFATLGVWNGHITYLLNIVTNLLLPILVVTVALLAIHWNLREKRIARSREEDGQKYISKILEAQESERQRIARELHDDTIQTLLVILSCAERLQTVEDAEVKESSKTIKDNTIGAVDNLRRICRDLRPSILDNMGLIPALKWLAGRINGEGNLHILILVNGIERKLPSPAENAIFRITQEALNNIRRHSKASNAVVTLEFTEASLKLTIQDDGQGFSIPGKLGTLYDEGKLGLFGMQQRIDALGGTFQINSSPDEGTVLSFAINN
jgi:two-component system, NarL family, sensor histidine kinase DegS